MQTFIIGLSGPSSSGKTTLARLLRGIFDVDASPDTNNISLRLFILHADDFYKSDADIPLITVSSAEHGTRTVQDWDCVEALNLPLMDRTIRHVKAHGTAPPDMVSKEDQNSVGKVDVDDDEIGAHRKTVLEWLKNLSLSSLSDSNTTKTITICILDGFLLFPPPPSLLTSPDTVSDISTSSIPSLKSLHSTLDSVLDLKLFLPLTKRQTLERRARRTGYVTLEGFWADPPGYVEDVVWPNYARDHGWMFRSRGDVDDGKVEKEGEWVRKEGVVVGPGEGEVELGSILAWAVGVVREGVERVLMKEEK